MDKWGSISGRTREFIFHMMYQLGTWPIPFLIQWIPGALSPVVKQPVDRAAHSPSSVEVKNVQNQAFSVLCVFMTLCLI
jgi:hypothetical protein